MEIIKPKLEYGTDIHLKDLKIMKKCMENFIIKFNKRKDILFKSDKIKEQYVILDKINKSIDYYSNVK